MSAHPDYLKEMSYSVIYSLYELFIIVCTSFNNQDSFHALFKLNEISKTENICCEKTFDYHGWLHTRLLLVHLGTRGKVSCK